MPSESFRPEFHLIDDFDFDSAFVNSDLDHLLRRPGGGWMFSDVEMNDLTSLVQKNDEAVKVTEGCGGDSKEIDADDLPSMIGEESLPSLGRRLKCFDSIFGNC